MEIGEPDPRVGQPIEIGRLDFAAERAEIGKPEVVRHDHEEVGPLHAEASCQVGRPGGMLPQRHVVIVKAALSTPATMRHGKGFEMLPQFGMSIPLVAAPMSGGPTTPAMVSAATRAGGLGMLAAGYKTVEAVEAEVNRVRAEGIPFGINLFAPNPLPVDPEIYRAYAAIVQRDADQFGLTLPPDPVEDNDKFDEKIALLLDDPVPMVSFTFGIPPRRVIAALQKAKSVVVQTVTTPDEAAQARDAGVDMLAVQAVGRRRSLRHALAAQTVDAGADRRAGRTDRRDGAAAGDGRRRARHPRRGRRRDPCGCGGGRGRDGSAAR